MERKALAQPADLERRKKMTKKTSRTKTSFDKQRQGLEAVIKGLSFERRVGEYLSKQGYKISSRPVGKLKFDVVGKRWDDWEGRYRYCIAECKDKPRVTATDLQHFMAKLRKFYERLPVDIDGDKPKVQGLLAYTGELPSDARNATKLSTKVPITFKKF